MAATGSVQCQKLSKKKKKEVEDSPDTTAEPQMEEIGSQTDSSAFISQHMEIGLKGSCSAQFPTRSETNAHPSFAVCYSISCNHCKALFTVEHGSPFSSAPQWYVGRKC